MKINLGVLDVPYGASTSYRAVGRRRAPRRALRSRSTMTTGQVADILEARYGITEFFIEHHAEEFVKDILEGHAENLARPVSGLGSRTDHLNKALKRGEELFREMLDNKELDGYRAGVPTLASQRDARSSFVDTGLYRDAFRIEVEE